jgi:hypothetical protein
MWALFRPRTTLGAQFLDKIFAETLNYALQTPRRQHTNTANSVDLIHRLPTSNVIYREVRTVDRAGHSIKMPRSVSSAQQKCSGIIWNAEGNIDERCTHNQKMMFLLGDRPCRERGAEIDKWSTNGSNIWQWNKKKRTSQFECSTASCNLYRIEPNLHVGFMFAHRWSHTLYENIYLLFPFTSFVCTSVPASLYWSARAGRLLPEVDDNGCYRKYVRGHKSEFGCIRKSAFSAKCNKLISLRR